MNRFKPFFALLLAALFLFAFTGCTKERYTVSWFDVFDTVTILLAYSDSEEEFSQQSQAIKQELTEYHKLYDIYHTYPDMNNLKTINDNAGIAPVEVDQRIIDLLLLGKDLYTLTDGQVNIAMGSVLSIWHDARELAEQDPAAAAVPDMEQLQQAAAHTDINALIIDQQAGTVFLSDPEMRLDVGSLGKGYAAEMVMHTAQESGVEDALLSVGGNLRAIGKKPNGSWTGGIQNPWPDQENASLYTIELSDCALVTSGDYQRYYEVDGTRYHHIIDPDTLMPANYVNSVSVICPDSAMADGLSTALFNMSVEDGMALVESLENTEAVWLLPDQNTKISSEFAEFCK